MATATDTETPAEELSAPRTKTQITAEAKAKAAAQLAEVNAQLATPEVAATDFSAPRQKRGGANKTFVPDKSMPLSQYAPNLDPDNFGPQAFAAIMYGERTGTSHTQQFTLDPDRATYLCFTAPNQNLPKKRLYTVKAFHRDGRLVQLPFEMQINNTAGGDLTDAIGIRRYERKGMSILIDWSTLQPIYCAAWGCMAKADGVTGFCGQRHAEHTMPNRFKDAGAIAKGVFGENATTSRIWSA